MSSALGWLPYSPTVMAFCPLTSGVNPPLKTPNRFLNTPPNCRNSSGQLVRRRPTMT
ncbi:Uncharacterised protein [uncultured archaeon]|nr:Uncharacterised protein [uncultured archaeon]